MRLFRAKETRHELVQGFKYNGIQVRNIPYLNEEGEVAYRMENCLSIGCHLCPESKRRESREIGIYREPTINGI